MKTIFKETIIFGIIVFVLLITLSCKDRHLSSNELIVDTNEKIVYKEVQRDTIINIPTDSSTIFALLDCDSLNKVYLKEISNLQGKRSSINFKTQQTNKGYVVEADCECDSLDIAITMIERYSDYRKKTDTNSTKVEVKKCNEFKLFLQGCGLGAAITAILIIGFKFLIKLYKTTYEIRR